MPASPDTKPMRWARRARNRTPRGDGRRRRPVARALLGLAAACAAPFLALGIAVAICLWWMALREGGTPVPTAFAAGAGILYLWLRPGRKWKRL